MARWEAGLLDRASVRASRPRRPSEWRWTGAMGSNVGAGRRRRCAGDHRVARPVAGVSFGNRPAGTLGPGAEGQQHGDAAAVGIVGVGAELLTQELLLQPGLQPEAE